jgi:hypothetical protein
MAPDFNGTSRPEAEQSVGYLLGPFNGIGLFQCVNLGVSQFLTNKQTGSRCLLQPEGKLAVQEDTDAVLAPLLWLELGYFKDHKSVSDPHNKKWPRLQPRPQVRIHY